MNQLLSIPDSFINFNVDFLTHCIYYLLLSKSINNDRYIFLRAAHPLILSLTVLRVQHQLSGTHCLLLLGLLIALVLLGLDLKLTYSKKPMPPSVSVTQRL